MDTWDFKATHLLPRPVMTMYFGDLVVGMVWVVYVVWIVDTNWVPRADWIVDTDFVVRMDWIVDMD